MPPGEWQGGGHSGEFGRKGLRLAGGVAVLLPWVLTISIVVFASTAGFALAGHHHTASEVRLMLAGYITERIAEFDRIPVERKAELKQIADFVSKRRESDRLAQLTFICTHNSRRSHMSQLWAQVAAVHFGLSGVETFSGGIEATAFNPRAVTALERAGFRVEKIGQGENPVYHVFFGDEVPPLPAFSKVFNEAPNPVDGFCAVMTCSHADQACPIVEGAAARIAIPYEDPKAYDGTDREAEMYDARCRQIACEMLYLFSLVAAT